MLRSLYYGLLRLVLGASICLSAPSARSDEIPEYRLKAAVIYNFAAFTEWPTTVGATLNLCIFGPDPFGPEIDGLNGKNVGAHTLAVQRKSTLDELKDCQIVFVSRSAIDQIPRLLTIIQGSPTLTVADNPGAARAGIALNLNVAADRISFEANLEAARSAGIDLSSKLLRLATEVIK